MSRSFTIAGSLLGLLIIGILVVACGAAQKMPAIAPTVFSPAPPTFSPPGYIPSYTGTPLTATPRPGEVGPTANVFTPTPLPISKTTDLAQGVPDEDKYIYVVQHSDGTYEKYLIPANYPGDERQLMGLGPQDVIIYGNPLVPMPRSTPQVTAVSVTPTLTPTLTYTPAYP